MISHNAIKGIYTVRNGRTLILKCRKWGKQQCHAYIIVTWLMSKFNQCEASLQLYLALGEQHHLLI